RGEKLTTTSDVYSLGVMLYELLTGMRPHRVKDSQPHELARLVCEEDPVRPSKAISDFALRSAEEKTNRTAESGAHSQFVIRNPRLLHGDLDNIVLMALRKDPQRRYESAAQLSADIERHLTG